MTILALPFVFGSLRSAGAGARLVVGLIKDSTPTRGMMGLRNCVRPWPNE
jgi:hypothetical protein